MKYLKSYENNNNQIKINILDFINFVGNMYDAVEYLIGLKNISKYGIFSDINDNLIDITHNKIDKSSKFYKQPGDEEAMSITYNDGRATYSYGFIKNDRNISITFYTIPEIKTYQDILTIVDAYKFNL